MSQPATSSRLTNSAVNIIGATTAVNTNFGLNKIGVTGNSFDISSSSGTVTLGITGTGNVQIGNGTSGTVTFPGATTFTQPVNGGVFTGTAINGTAATTALTIGSNLTTGSVTIGAQSANTVTIGANSTGATGTVNVGTGSATINIGSTAASAIVIGNTAGTVTLRCPITLGPEPTTAGQLGFVTLSGNGAITNLTVNTTNSPLDYASFAWNTPGVWIVNYFYYGGTSTLTTNASLSLFTGSTGGYTLGASTAPWVVTTVAPVGGVGGTNAIVAGGSFITTNTGATVTWDVCVNVYSGSIATYRGWAYTSFTRIG